MCVCVCVCVWGGLTVLLLVDLRDGLGDDGAEGDGGGGGGVAGVAHVVGDLLDVLQGLLSLLLLQGRHHVLVGLAGLLGEGHQLVEQGLAAEREREGMRAVKRDLKHLDRSILPF